VNEWLEASGWALPQTLDVVMLASRSLSAAVFGAAIGWERQLHGREAGLRTHMLVALGAALFVLTPLLAGGDAADIAGVIRGIAPGIGFIGGGAILKLASEHDIKGLTTAASIWLTSAVGVAAGAGKMWAAMVAVLLSLFILAVLAKFEKRWHLGHHHPKTEHEEPAS
jgi:putative Mg2+ transporter-C (MgtC) family protein